MAPSVPNQQQPLAMSVHGLQSISAMCRVTLTRLLPGQFFTECHHRVRFSSAKVPAVSCGAGLRTSYMYCMMSILVSGSEHVKNNKLPRQMLTFWQAMLSIGKLGLRSTVRVHPLSTHRRKHCIMKSATTNKYPTEP